jgi:hypothetical protein
MSTAYLRSVSISIVLLVVSSTKAPAQVSPRTVTDSDVHRVLDAIRDEIYANDWEVRYLDMPADSIPVYVQPYREGKLMWIIYKLMPFGELKRAAWDSPDGRVVLLAGNPRNGFPPTRETAVPTVFLNDDDVMHMKRTWKRVWLSINFRPAGDDIRVAKNRQALRDSIQGWR